MNNRSKIISIVAGVVVLTVLMFPLVQQIVYAVIIQTPSVPVFMMIGGVGIGVIILLNKYEYMSTESVNTWKSVIVVVCVGMAFFVGPLVGGVYANVEMSDRVNENVVELETLPDSSSESVRVLPRGIADEFAESSMQEPRYRLTESDITQVNGSYVWSYGVVPDTLFISLTGNQNGALYVDMEQAEKSVDVVEDPFNTGRGQLIFDSYWRQSILSNPFEKHQLDTVFNSQYNDESYIAHSTVTHEWQIRLFPIPMVYTIPEHGSVQIMDTTGEISVYTPDEAGELDQLHGENFYPYNLATFKVNSLQFEKGALSELPRPTQPSKTASLRTGLPAKIPSNSD